MGWDITDTVGSTGTETNGLQLLKGSTVKIQNGALTSKTAKLLIQNYCNLTIDNVKLSGTDNLTQYIVSNNNGSTTITGGSEITAAEGGIAFDGQMIACFGDGNCFVACRSNLQKVFNSRSDRFSHSVNQPHLFHFQ